MSMCYLCDLCANRFRLHTSKDNKLNCFLHDLKVIDWGAQDPKEVCKHFALKVVS